jgi:hypothetical protein
MLNNYFAGRAAMDAMIDGVVGNELRVYQPTSSVKATERESI